MYYISDFFFSTKIISTFLFCLPPSIYLVFHNFSLASHILSLLSFASSHFPYSCGLGVSPLGSHI